MSKLLLHEVNQATSNLKQKFTCVGNKDIYAVRLHLYKHQNPTGTLAVYLTDTNGRKIATSPTVDLTTIGSTSYYHGFVRFVLSSGDACLRDGESFLLELVPGSYTFAEANYVGWVTDFGHKRKYSAPYLDGDDFLSPLDVEFWCYKKISKGGVVMRTLDFDDGFTTASAPSAISSELSMTIANNQSSAANITDASFDVTLYSGFIIEYDIRRDTSTSHIGGTGRIEGHVYNGSWVLTDATENEDTSAGSGVTFSISTAGQLKYTSTNMSGTGYTGSMKYTARRFSA